MLSYNILSDQQTFLLLHLLKEYRQVSVNNLSYFCILASGWNKLWRDIVAFYRSTILFITIIIKVAIW